MIIDRLDLDTAIAEGIISRDQAAQLRDLSLRHSAADDSSIEFSQDTSDEPFRLLRGFRDVFIAIGVAIFSVGITAMAVSYIVPTTHRSGFLFELDAGFVSVLSVSLILCLVGFAQAELITRRQRLPLASMVVSIAFAAWFACLFGSIATLVAQPLAQAPLRSVQLAAQAVAWAAVFGAVVGVVLFYWRYRLPFALFLLAATFVGLPILIVKDILGDAWFEAYGRMLVGLSGLAVFAAAMWFDVRDRLRVSRFSECAFWLHLFAAPLLVHALLFGDPLGGPNLVFVLGTMAVLSIVALLIDRRALLVSGLSYLAIAISQLVSSSALFADKEFAPTALILGGIILTLGLGWTPIRRHVLALLPLEGLKSRLPPAPA